MQPQGAEDRREPEGGSARRALEVLAAASKLGVTSFGGPIAHIGYFREEYVRRRGWLAEEDFAALVGLCQTLPGPASSQLGIAIGMLRAGPLGGLAAWFGFTLPSAVALAAFAEALSGHDFAATGWVHGLKLVAVAVVAQAVWTMARTLTPDRIRLAAAAIAAAAVLLAGSPLVQLAVIGAGALFGAAFLEGPARRGRPPLRFGVSKTAGAAALACFAAFLVALPLVRHATGSHAAATADSFYRSGALVFGGGHVVLPLLQAQVVEPGWVRSADFLAGYGAAQAVPGPLFTFAAYLGAVQTPEPNGLAGAALALAAIFLPAFLLVVGVAPFWAALRRGRRVLAAIAGVNAAVVGLLLAALYHPVFTSAVLAPRDFAVVLAAFVLLAVWRVPPWAAVGLCAAAGALGL